jgi:hypothetical protein
MSPNTQTFVATATPNIVVSQASVTLGAQAIPASSNPIDLSSVDSTMIVRVADSTTNQGAMFLTATNPFAVGANTTLTFTGTNSKGTAITPIVKTVTLPPGGSTPTTVRIDFTGTELRSMLGSNLTATFTGTTTAGTTTVKPTDKISFTSRLQIRLYVVEVK